jgi:DME family drug/metabolite transporter
MSVLAPLAAAFVWGLNPAVVKYATHHLGGREINALRLLGAALLLSLLGLLGPWQEVLHMPLRVWGLAFLAALAGPIVAWGAYIQALHRLPLSIAHPVANTYPLSAIALEMAFRHVVPPPLAWAGVLLILVGVNGLRLTGSDHEKGGDPRDLAGWSFALLTSLFWGVSSLLFQLLVHHLSPFATTLARSLIAAPLLLMMAPTTLKVLRTPTLRLPVGAAALSGILNDVAGMYFYLVALRHFPLYLAVPLSSTSPLFAVLWGGLFWEERVTGARWAAVATVVGGTVLLGLSGRPA